MRITRPLLVPVCLALLLAACEQESITYREPPEVTEDTSDAGGGGDVVEDVAPAGFVGKACETDDDCVPGQCINDTLLAGFGIDTNEINAPGGMCSVLFCDGDEACGPNASCFDLQSAFGAPVNLCLQLCDKLPDCRWQEAYSCFAPIADDERTVCLPDSIVVAIQCDDGSCEEGTP